MSTENVKVSTIPVKPPTTEKTTSPQQEFKFDEKLVETKLKLVGERVLSFAGKRNYNPYLWIKKHLDPLVARFTKGERTAALQHDVLALPDNAVPLTVSGEASIEEEKPEPTPKMEMTPTGIKLVK